MLSSCVLGQTVWLDRVSEYCSFSSLSKHVYETFWLSVYVLEIESIVTHQVHVLWKILGSGL